MSHGRRDIPRIALFIEATTSQGGYQGKLWRGIADRLKDEATLLCVAGGALESAPNNIYERQRNRVYQLITSHNVDGIIVSGSIGTHMKASNLAQFCAQFSPLPIVTTMVALPNCPAIRIKDSLGMFALMDHLLNKHAYRRIAFICGDIENPEAKQRYEVYRAALRQANIEVDENLVAGGDFFNQSGAEAIRTLLLERGVTVDAIVAANDNMALGAIEEAKRIGRLVPEDLAIVGFDDIDEAKMSTPSLTTVWHPVYDLGVSVAEAMLARLRGSSENKKIHLDTTLRVRQSCGCREDAASIATWNPPPPSVNEQAGVSPKTIADRIILSMGNGLGAQMRGLIESMVSALIADARLETPGAFSAALDVTLQQGIANELSPTIWHEAIFLLNKALSGLPADDSTRRRTLGMLRQAHKTIARATEQRDFYRALEEELRIDTLTAIHQALVPAREPTRLEYALSRGLPKLGIPSCLVVGYNPDSVEGESARIISMHDSRSPFPGAPEMRTFSVRELFPAAFFADQVPRSLILEPLCFKDNQIGYAIFEADTVDGKIFETLREQLSAVLWASELSRKQEKLLEQERELVQIREEISQQLMLKEVADGILESLSRQVPFRKASLQLVVDGFRSQLASRGFDLESEVAWYSTVVAEDALISRVLSSREPTILSDTSKDPDWKCEKWTEDVKSWIGLPLFCLDDVIGLVTLDHDVPGFFTSSYRDKLYAIAQQGAISLYRAYQLYLAEERTDQMELVRKVARITATQDGTSRPLHTLCIELAKRLTCTHCTIFFPEEVGGPVRLVPVASNNTIDGPLGPRTFALDEGLVGHVFQSGRTEMSGDATEDPRFAAQRYGNTQSRSMLLVPLKSASRTIGVICADQDEKNWFTLSKRRLVEAVAAQTAIALERTFGLTLIQSIGQRITTLADIGKVLEEIVQGAIKLTHTTTGIIYLISEDGTSVQRSFHPAGFEHPRPRLESPTGLTSELLRTGEVLPVRNAAADGRVHPTLRARFKSIIGIPLKLREKTVGVLYLNDEVDHEFTDTEIAMLRTLASQAAIAIESVRLLEDGQRKFEKLKGLNEAITKTNHVQQELIELMSETQPQEDARELLLKFGAKIELWPGISGVGVLLPGKGNRYDLASCSLLSDEQMGELRGLDLSKQEHAKKLRGGVRLSPIQVPDSDPVFLVTKVNSEYVDAAEPWLKMVELVIKYLADIGHFMAAADTLRADNERLQWHAVVTTVSRLHNHEALNALKGFESWLTNARRGNVNLDALNVIVTELREHITDFMNATDFTKLRPRICDFGAELEKALRRLNVRNQRKFEGCELRVDLVQHPRRKVLMDPSSLMAIVSNLIINAKEQYASVGRYGPICITSREEDIGEGTYVGFEVMDYGIGIAAEPLEKVFEAGYTTKPNGHGLGLWIVRKIVAACDGRIRAESVVGHYAKFIVVYPILE